VVHCRGFPRVLWGSCLLIDRGVVWQKTKGIGEVWWDVWSPSVLLCCTTWLLSLFVAYAAFCGGKGARIGLAIVTLALFCAATTLVLFLLWHFDDVVDDIGQVYSRFGLQNVIPRILGDCCPLPSGWVRECDDKAPCRERIQNTFVEYPEPYCPEPY